MIYTNLILRPLLEGRDVGIGREARFTQGRDVGMGREARFTQIQMESFMMQLNYACLDRNEISVCHCRFKWLYECLSVRFFQC